MPTRTFTLRDLRRRIDEMAEAGVSLDIPVTINADDGLADHIDGRVLLRARGIETIGYEAQVIG